MPNLIVILFNLLYPVFIVEFNCKGCVRGRERVWRLKQIEDWRVFVGSSRLSIPRNDACALYMTGMRKVKIDGDNCVLRVARGKAFPQDTHETFYFTRLSYLIHTFYIHTIYTIITKKCWGVLLRENPSHKPWELEIVISTILNTNCLWIFLKLLPLHFHIIKRLIAQTLTTPFQSVQWDFGIVGKYRKKPGLSGCNWAYCGIQRAR